MTKHKQQATHMIHTMRKIDLLFQSSVKILKFTTGE